MDEAERIADALVRWEQTRDAGRDLSPAELCPDEPSLWEVLERRLAKRRRFARFATPSTTPVTESPLPQVPGYEVLEVVGHGGMGIVYKARQLKLDRLVALKMILTEAAPDLARFQTEAEAVARLEHPNVIRIHEAGEHQGRPYLVLEWADGGSLAQSLEGTPLPARTAAALLLPVARAAAYAHSRGIIHRDLKPSNVLLSEDGTPRIADFGLAKRLDEDGGRTQTGAVLGTPNYMAPEQAAGLTRQVGPATDVYALGVMLYEMLTGRPPFVGGSLLETLEQVREHDPVPPSRLQPTVPRDLETVCLKCLHKAPTDRYASAEQLAADLQAFLDGEPVGARSLSTADQIVRAIRHHQLDERVASAGTFLLAVAPMVLGSHVAAYVLCGRSTYFPEIITLVSLLTVVLLPLLLLGGNPAVMRALPRIVRQRLWNTWTANCAASLLTPVLIWVKAGPEHLLLSYSVWMLLAGLAYFAYADLLGLNHLIGTVIFALAVVTALAPSAAPLIVAAVATTNMTVQGLLFRSVRSSRG